MNRLLGEKAEKVVTDMNAAIQKLNQAYLDATEKIKADAIKGLEKERSRTKDGLVGMAIQHQITFIEKMKPPVDFLGRVIPKAPNPTDIIGTWDALTPKGKEVYDFAADKSLKVNGTDGASWSTTEESLIIIFKSGNTVSFGIPVDGKAVGSYSRGGEYTITKRD